MDKAKIRNVWLIGAVYRNNSETLYLRTTNEKKKNNITGLGTIRDAVSEKTEFS